MVSNEIEVALSIVGLIWASASTFLDAYKELNNKRDQIMDGLIDGAPVSKDRRLLMLNSDWAPLIAVMIVLSFSFFVVSLSLPSLTESTGKTAAIWLICLSGALFSGICCLSWLIFGRVEYLKMKSMLLEETQ